MKISIPFILLVFALPLLGCANKPDVEFTLKPESPADPEPILHAAPKPAALSVAPEKGKEKKAEKAAKSKEAKNFPPGWFSDYEQALAKAKSTGQPLLILFH